MQHKFPALVILYPCSTVLFNSSPVTWQAHISDLHFCTTTAKHLIISLYRPAKRGYRSPSGRGGSARQGGGRLGWHLSWPLWFLIGPLWRCQDRPTEHQSASRAGPLAVVITDPATELISQTHSPLVLSHSCFLYNNIYTPRLKRCIFIFARLLSFEGL